MAQRFVIRNATGDDGTTQGGRMSGTLYNAWFNIRPDTFFTSSIAKHYKLVVSKFITTQLTTPPYWLEIKCNINPINSVGNYFGGTALYTSDTQKENTIAIVPIANTFDGTNLYQWGQYINDNVDNSRGVEVIIDNVNFNLNITISDQFGNEPTITADSNKEGWIMEFYLIPLPNIY